MRIVVFVALLLHTLFGFGFVTEPSQIVPVEKAYKPQVSLNNNRLDVNISIDKSAYLYKKYIKLKINNQEVKLHLPPAFKEHGEEVYEKQLNFSVPLKMSGKIDVDLEYQGCNKAGVCYPPQQKHFTFTIEEPQAASAKKSQTPKLSEADSIASTLQKGSLGVILATFFGFGVLLALTPCVFPMIPILSSLIVGAKNMNTKKAFLYSVVYVLAMSIAYTGAGVLAGIFGANLQSALQNPLIIILFALIFVVLALSMFGFYEIGLPASWQTKIAQKSDEAGSKGGLIGVAIMGFLSALIVGPCVAPPLAGALIYIGQTGDAILGGLALFAMSLGMGLPLLLVGVGAGKFMPKPGGWMEAVSKVFGVIMLGLAIWMLERILPPAVTMFLWGVLFIGSAVYLRALEQIPEEAHWFVYFKKSVGIVLLIYGVFVLYGSLKGATNVLKPFGFIEQSVTNQIQKSIFEPISSLDELKKILATAKKPVMVDVTAKWCASCKELEENTFSDPRVRQKLGEFRALRLDMTKNTPQAKEFLRHFGLFGPPAIIFFDRSGKEIKNLRIIGYKDPNEFLEILNKAQRMQ
ncbi:protein-disulfide reductase DsbD [Nitratiruptor sp. YY09-18]|uniref:protein-disulfide reductase DsbD n=1 Tax=Nitratiruptor sp. YY09-18 TaxID=2724901 RepID=UPI0019164B7F|nr:protein-disulfide reductase DsbD [Nitratiruptor sp. YY09-18]BCD67885.1 thiol:disulfide interchange protein DsbD [Nitratiruptor sp. YY09-18]